ARCGVPASCSPPSDSPSACGCRNGRPVDSYELLALAALALGGSVVLVALLDARRGWQLSGMSIALPALLFGAFAVLDQKGVRPFAGPVYGYAALLAPWGLVELRR
ncbi:MAG: hypothetical protein JWN77_1930, partial [Frankiales bacterium]|nr:hypothetical protein [Frankiales bacterium]